MPSFTTTIEDFSPAITYSSDWVQGTSQSDGLTSSYSASSFFASNVTGGTASFTFTGTGVELFGSNRQNHGLYQVIIDGQTSPTSSGQSNNPIFQTLLFSNIGLPQGEHTVVLQNQGSNAQFVDLDFITWYGNIGQSNEQLSVDTVEDNDPSFVYSPNSAWTDNPSNLGFFHGSTGHSTTTPGASFSYTFQGDGVSLFGPVGPGYSSFSVQLNGVSQDFTAQKSQNASQVMLYHVDSLGPGQHTVEVLVQPSTGQAFAIDYAEVFSTPSTLGSSSKSGGLSGGAVAGLVIGLLIACGILIAGIWLHLRRRRNRVKHCSDGPGALEAEFGNASNPFNDKTGPVMYERNSEHTTPSRLLDPTPSFVDFTSGNTSSIGDERSESGSHSYASSTDSLSRRDTNSTSPRRNLSVTSRSSINAGRLLYTKGAAPALPESAGESLADVSVEQLAATRMVVEGRPQDFGAVLESDENVASGSTVSESYREHHPPPDYHQATEVYH